MREWWMRRGRELRVCLVRLETAAYGWSAQSTVEYALVGALVVIAGAAALSIIGEQVNGIFTNLGNTLKAPAPK
jgi:Flp pilus assembly pilin Flp